MKRRMKTRNVVCDEFIMGTHWREKSSLSSKFNFRSPLDSLTNFMSGFWTSDDLFVIVVNCHKPPNDHTMFSETRLWKGRSWTLKVGLCTHTQSAASTHSCLQTQVCHFFLIILCWTSAKPGKNVFFSLEVAPLVGSYLFICILCWLNIIPFLLFSFFVISVFI